ncbi:MAG: hypothetical protein IE931_13755 [Sphingobacteriales bacterium]|nr:hypothetical protein [Sphingobacteriales bacterium]
MKIIICILVLIIVNFPNLYAQSDRFNPSKDNVYNLLNDTLFTNRGIRIIVGQKLIVGKGSDKNGWYSSMQFRSPFNWSIWLFRDMELNNSTNPSKVDAEQERERDSLRDFFHEGDSVLVKKIKRKGNKKYGYWYVLYLKTLKFPKANFICNINLAIKKKEIIIE